MKKYIVSYFDDVDYVLRCQNYPTKRKAKAALKNFPKANLSVYKVKKK